MNPLEDDDISHDSEAYRRWKGGTDNPLQSKQEEVLGKGPHPTAGLDTALPLAFRSFFATAWCSFLIVFNIILRFGGEGAPPFLFIQIFMVPFYGVGLFLLYRKNVSTLHRPVATLCFLPSSHQNPVRVISPSKLLRPKLIC